MFSCAPAWRAVLLVNKIVQLCSSLKSSPFRKYNCSVVLQPGEHLKEPWTISTSSPTTSSWSVWGSSFQSSSSSTPHSTCTWSLIRYLHLLIIFGKINSQELLIKNLISKIIYSHCIRKLKSELQMIWFTTWKKILESNLFSDGLTLYQDIYICFSEQHY